MYLSQTFCKKHNYYKRGTFKIYRILIFGSNSFSMECYGHKHETLLVSPGSLHMNLSIENIVYTQFTKKTVFEHLMLAVELAAVMAAKKYRSLNAT